MWSWMSWRIYLGSSEGVKEKEQNRNRMRIRMRKGKRKRMDDKN